MSVSARLISNATQTFEPFVVVEVSLASRLCDTELLDDQPRAYQPHDISPLMNLSERP